MMEDVLAIRELVLTVVRSFAAFRPYRPAVVESFVVVVAGLTDTSFILPAGTWRMSFCASATVSSKNCAIRFSDSAVTYPANSSKPMGGVVIIPGVARNAADELVEMVQVDQTCHAVMDVAGNESIRFVRIL